MLKSYSAAAPVADTGLLVDSGRAEVEPVAPDLSYPELPLSVQPSQWEVCMTGL